MSESKTPTLSVDPCTDADVAHLKARERQSGFAEKNMGLQQEGEYYFLIGRVGDEVAGYVVLDLREDTDLAPEMKYMLVYPEFRRQGLGEALARALETVAAEQGYDEVYLSVDPENPAAIPLYINLDYGPTGNHRISAQRNVAADGTVTEVEVHNAIYRKSLRLR